MYCGIDPHGLTVQHMFGATPKLYTTPRTWHPHIYEKPPKQPTPHSIRNILGMVTDEKLSLDEIRHPALYSAHSHSLSHVHPAAVLHRSHLATRRGLGGDLSSPLTNNGSHHHHHHLNGSIVITNSGSSNSNSPVIGSGVPPVSGGTISGIAIGGRRSPSPGPGNPHYHHHHHNNNNNNNNSNSSGITNGVSGGGGVVSGRDGGGGGLAAPFLHHHHHSLHGGRTSPGSIPARDAASLNGANNISINNNSNNNNNNINNNNNNNNNNNTNNDDNNNDCHHHHHHHHYHHHNHHLKKDPTQRCSKSPTLAQQLSSSSSSSSSSGNGGVIGLNSSSSSAAGQSPTALVQCTNLDCKYRSVGATDLRGDTLSPSCDKLGNDCSVSVESTQNISACSISKLDESSSSEDMARQRWYLQRSLVRFSKNTAAIH